MTFLWTSSAVELFSSWNSSVIEKFLGIEYDILKILLNIILQVHVHVLNSWT